jgi:hypothetical protein
MVGGSTLKKLASNMVYFSKLAPTIAYRPIILAVHFCCCLEAVVFRYDKIETSDKTSSNFSAELSFLSIYTKHFNC